MGGASRPWAYSKRGRRERREKGEERALSSYLWRVLSERPWAAPAAPGHIRREEEKRGKRREKGEERDRKNHLVIIV